MKKNVWIIYWNPETQRFGLVMPDGHPVMVIDQSFKPSPKELSRHAFSHDADQVIWDFDLNLDPDK